VARIHTESWRATYQGMVPDSYLDKLDPVANEPRWRITTLTSPPDLFVVEDDGAVLGFCQIATGRDDDLDESIGEITGIYLAPAVIRRGYGHQLCNHALAELRQRGYREAILWVLKMNAGARAFYEAQGFSLDGGEKYYKRLKADAVRYRIVL